MSSKNKRKNLASGFAVNLQGLTNRPLPSADVLAKAAALAEPAAQVATTEPERILSVVELAPEPIAETAVSEELAPVEALPAITEAEEPTAPVVTPELEVVAEAVPEAPVVKAPAAAAKKPARAKEATPKTLVGTGTMLRRAPSEDYARLALNISPDLHRRLKLACVKEGMSLSHAGEVALAAYLESLGH